MPPTPAISLDQVTVLLSGRTILHDISWTVTHGTCAAILGPNGAGKSTLVRVLTGYQYPTRGTVSVLGNPFGQTNLNDLRKSIRLVQPPNAYDLEPDLTVRQAALTGFFGTRILFDHPTPKQIHRANHVLNQLHLDHLADRPYSTLSTGERTRALIARATVDPAPLLLLDEPTTGLDLPSRESILHTIEQLLASANPPTILLTTHHVEELPPSTQNILLLHHGKTAARGAPEQVLTESTLSHVYQIPITVHQDHGRYYLHIGPTRFPRSAEASG